MSTVRYVGPHASVDLPTLDLFGVKPGDPVEVPAAVARSLTASGDWKAKTAAKKATKTAPSKGEDTPTTAAADQKED